MLTTRNLDVRLYRIICKKYTQYISTISIIKFATNRFRIKAMCFIFNKLKTKFLHKEQIKLLQNKICKSVDCSTFNNNVTIDKTLYRSFHYLQC